MLILSAEIRERDWSNVVTCHMDTVHAYVWRLQNFVLGEHILTPSADVQTPVKVINPCHLSLFDYYNNLQHGLFAYCYLKDFICCLF